MCVYDMVCVCLTYIYIYVCVRVMPPCGFFLMGKDGT